MHFPHLRSSRPSAVDFFQWKMPYGSSGLWHRTPGKRCRSMSLLRMTAFSWRARAAMRRRLDNSDVQALQPRLHPGGGFGNSHGISENPGARADAHKTEDDYAGESDFLAAFHLPLQPRGGTGMMRGGGIVGADQKIDIRDNHFPPPVWDSRNASVSISSRRN